MNRGLDSRMQNILQNANGTFNDDEYIQNLQFIPERASSTNWGFGLSPRQPLRRPSPFTGLGECGFSSPYRYPVDFYSPYDSSLRKNRQTSSIAHLGLNRISFMPQTAYHEVNLRRTMSNAENKFRFKQHLRQGTSLHESQQRTFEPNPDAVTQLANAMLLRQPLVNLRDSKPNMEPTCLENRQNLGKNSPNISQRCQVPALFKSSSNLQTPGSQSASATSSSSFAGISSSPTARLSFRRESNRAIESNYQDSDLISNKDEDNPGTQSTYIYSNLLPSPDPKCLALKHAPPMAQGIQLISPHELPDRIRQIFPYELFNAVQSKCFGTIHNTDDNLVVSAPTGSGKTALLELAICRLIESCPSEQYKIVYLAPTKSLCSQRVRDWQKKFSHLNLPCAELTGDTNQFEMTRVRNASIIVTTPEKWDSITRKWSDHFRLVQLVKLFLIDEVHILKDLRGATLEAVVSRMKAMGACIRFIALSATVPNSEDIAIWLGRDHSNQHLPAYRENFGEEFRPVKLEKYVHGYDGSFNDYAFDKFLDGKLTSLLQKYTHRKPTMIFCFTRKSCEATALMLSEWWTRLRTIENVWPTPFQKIVVGNIELQKVVVCGVAFHHAGLDAQDRYAIEDGFLKGAISIICCTSTLAVGVNLPCHIVVLKGTVGFQDGALREYSDLEVMQMLGRAGRPQFDDSAIAIIMTRAAKTKHYNQMISGQDILESTLHLNLIEHLNSEISLGSVKDLYQARTWITKTFLSVRMRKNPDHYKIADITEGGNTDERLEKVCERDIKLLQAYDLVTNEERFVCTEYGEAMCRYMVQFETMKTLLSIPKKASLEQILKIICQATEFKDLRMKPAERSCLKKLNQSPFVKFPISESISTSAHKVSLIIQVQLGGVQCPDEKEFGVFRRQFLIDKHVIFERIHRLIRCVIDCKAFDGDAVSTRNALDLARSLSAEYWEKSNLQLRQVPQIGPVAHRKLCHANITTVEGFGALDTASIERILSKNPPYGKKLKDILALFPRLKISASIIKKIITNTKQKPQVHVRAIIGYENNEVPIWNHKKPAVVFIAESSGGELSHIWRGNITKLDKVFELKFTVTLSQVEEEIRCWVACEEIVGTLKYCVLQHDFPPSSFPPVASELKDRTTNNSNDGIFDSLDEFGIDELGDEEMLAVAKSIEKPIYTFQPDDFTDVNLFDNDMESMTLNSRKNQVNLHAKEIIESTQMKNGKWTCQHDCRNGGLRKNGQRCKHRCCHEGIDKPSRPKQRASNIKETFQKDVPSEVIYSQKDTRNATIDLNKLDFKVSQHYKRRSEINTNKEEKSKLAQDTFKEVEIIDLTSDLSDSSLVDFSNKEMKFKDKESYGPFKEKQTVLPHISDIDADELTDLSITVDKDYNLEYSIPESPFPTTSMEDGKNIFSSNKDPFENSDNEFLEVNMQTAKNFETLIDNDICSMVGTNQLLNTNMRNCDVLDEDTKIAEDLDTTRKISMTSSENDKTFNSKRKRCPSPEEYDTIKCHTKEINCTPKRNSSRLIPEWVKEFDAELIDELKEYVDFID
ncbi:ATP-dependent DNA helicase MER3 [Erysiphe neolycopersici]|uniref:DNA 3'-5' helicase n=1 Tax=Erysiphe neolycopersici TaxID=212602 RepID=A0A420HPS3_9PEZI|nr:ATP-dependent DNA helicase MER3 [Erysiphe neolycopersici]